MMSSLVMRPARVIKSRRIDGRGMWHVWGRGETYKIVVETCLEDPSMYWMIILKWILTKSIRDGWINVTRGRNKWLVVNKIMNILVSQNVGNFFSD